MCRRIEGDLPLLPPGQDGGGSSPEARDLWCLADQTILTGWRTRDEKARIEPARLGDRRHAALACRGPYVLPACWPLEVVELDGEVLVITPLLSAPPVLNRDAEPRPV